MKRNVILPVLLMASASAFGQDTKAVPAGKCLIVYYSHTNTMRQIVDEIQAITNADVFRIEPSKPYPEEYRSCTVVAKEEKAADARPAIANKIADPDLYDTIFVGFPIWWGSRPMVVATLLESYDFKGKNIVPFCTHGGGGAGQAFNEVAAHTPGANHLKGLVLTSGQASGSHHRVKQWIDGILNIGYSSNN